MEAQTNINALTEYYKKISEKSGLATDFSRTRVEGFKEMGKRELQKAAGSGRIKLPDFTVMRTVGAKNINEDVMDLATGVKYRLAPGSKIKNVEVFAGKGVRKPYTNAFKYADKYGGNVEDWQHLKGTGYILIDDEERHVEIHWSRCESIRNVDRFIKRWLDED